MSTSAIVLPLPILTEPDCVPERSIPVEPAALVPVMLTDVAEKFVPLPEKSRPVSPAASPLIVTVPAVVVPLMPE